MIFGKTLKQAKNQLNSTNYYNIYLIVLNSYMVSVAAIKLTFDEKQTCNNHSFRLYNSNIFRNGHKR